MRCIVMVMVSTSMMCADDVCGHGNGEHLGEVYGHGVCGHGNGEHLDDVCGHGNGEHLGEVYGHGVYDR